VALACTLSSGLVTARALAEDAVPPPAPSDTAPPSESTAEPVTPPPAAGPAVDPPPPAPSEPPPAPPASTGTFPAEPAPGAPPAGTALSPPSSDSAAPRPSSPQTPLESARPATPDPGEPDREAKDSSHGLFGPLRIGPLFGLGVPSLLDIGGMVKLTKYFGAGINFGLVPEIAFSYYGDATVSYQSYDAFGHLHPFGGSFFLGARIGYASVQGSYVSDIRVSSGSFSGTLSYESRAKVKTMVLTPELGFLHTFDSGFTFGIDFGAQIPVAPSRIRFEDQVRTDLPVDAGDSNDEKVRETLERVGRTVLPTAHLRIGWML
jgi:hypothetical protein